MGGGDAPACHQQIGGSHRQEAPVGDLIPFPFAEIVVAGARAFRVMDVDVVVGNGNGIVEPGKRF